MSTLQELFEYTVAKVLSDKHSDFDQSILHAKFADMLPGLTDSIAESMLATIKKDYRSRSKTLWQQQQEFEKRTWALWKKPLGLLDLFITLAREAGDNCNSDLRNDATSSNTALVEALTRLHARACQISSVIAVLLRFGYADDAHARWRSLHEIAVVGHFIRENGEELAERYLLHETIQQYKLARAHREHAEHLNEILISQSEFESLKSSHDELVKHFGKPFSGDYGWAASVIKKNRPITMKDIECSIQFDHWRPYYRMASDNVHANAHGIYYRLGLSQTTDDKILLAGPSNMGLAEPGHSAAISLLQITVALLMIEPNLDRLTHSSILQNLEVEIGESFLQVARKSEALAASENDGPP